MDHYEWLENELKTLKRRTKLFIMLKKELSYHGYWRNKSRGNPKLGFKLGYGKHKSVD
jgi:hypothetical protein